VERDARDDAVLPRESRIQTQRQLSW